MKRITMKDIAAELEVSVQSVSQALNRTGRLGSETRRRILNAAERLNYRPNILARGLRNRRSYLLGVVFPFLNDSFFSRILGGIEDSSRRFHYDILIGNSFIDYSRRSDLDSLRKAEIDVLERMTNRGVDGIIGTPNPRIPGVYEKLAADGAVFFQLMKRIPGLNAGFLGVDNVEGGRTAVNHLISLGHERIGFLQTEFSEYEEIKDRGTGYLKALIARGIVLDTDRFEDPGDLSFHGAGSSALRLVKRNPDMTALFAPTDMAALGTLQALTEAGKRIPEELSVIGYDDLELAAYQVIHPLTTVAQPKEELGRKAFELLQEQIETGETRNLLMPPKLVVRRTTAPAG